jgi:hypothetical protein
VRFFLNLHCSASFCTIELADARGRGIIASRGDGHAVLATWRVRQAELVKERLLAGKTDGREERGLVLWGYYTLELGECFGG